jgi:hypothetical protein
MFCGLMEKFIQLHLHQINCDFLIHQTCCSCLHYLRSLDSSHDSKISFHSKQFQSFLSNVYIFCSGEYTLMVFRNLFPFRPWQISRIKPLIVITCFHVYCFFIHNVVMFWPFQHMFSK